MGLPITCRCAPIRMFTSMAMLIRPGSNGWMSLATTGFTAPSCSMIAPMKRWRISARPSASSNVQRRSAQYWNCWTNYRSTKAFISPIRSLKASHPHVIDVWKNFWRPAPASRSNGSSSFLRTSMHMPGGVICLPSGSTSVRVRTPFLRMGGFTHVTRSPYRPN